MALKNILEKIRADSERKNREIKEAALTAARQIEDEGKKKAASFKKEFLAKADEKAIKTREKIIVNTQLQVKKEILSLKQQFVTEVLVKAIERVRKSDKTYEQFLRKILSQFTQGKEEIILSAQDREKFSDKWLTAFNKKNRKKLKYSKETAKISGGIIIRSGRKETNSSLETLGKEIQEKHEAGIAKILFGEL